MQLAASFYVIIAMNKLAVQNTTRAGDQKLMIDLEWPYAAVQMVSITTDDTKTAQLRSISASTLTESTSPSLTTFSVSDPSQAQTSGSTFAYWQTWADKHRSNIGVLLFGLLAVFPCIGAAANPMPIILLCSNFTDTQQWWISRWPAFHWSKFWELCSWKSSSVSMDLEWKGVQSWHHAECFPSGQEVVIS